jgi:hypothetical protein
MRLRVRNAKRFVSTGKDYKSIEGVLDHAAWAPDKGPNVVALTLRRETDGTYWTYFFPYKPEAVLINGIVQEGTTSAALVNMHQGVSVKLYLDPAQGDGVAGVEIGGHQPTFNNLMRQAQPVQTVQQPSYAPPPVYYMPAPMMMGGFGGGCSSGVAAGAADTDPTSSRGGESCTMRSTTRRSLRISC